MLPVSLDCPFLIAPSVFSNVYIPSVSVTMYNALPIKLDDWKKIP
jgi:hypothetical protein